MPGIAYVREELRGTLRGYGPRTTEATVQLMRFDRGARLRRAGLGLVTWWTAALASVFIPVAHFVLVPGFLGFGVYSGVRRARSPVVPLEITGTCPDCDTDQAFDVPSRWSDPLDLACSSCRRRLQLSDVTLPV